MPPPRDTLDDLNPAQREAVVAETTPLVILAGAGSGKTRVLTRRIAWQVGQGRIDPRHVPGRDLHPQGRRGAHQPPAPPWGCATGDGRDVPRRWPTSQLRRRWADRREPSPACSSARSACSCRCCPPAPPWAWTAADVAAEIEWAKARLVTPDGYEAATVAAGPPHSPPGRRAGLALRALRDREAAPGPGRLRRPAVAGGRGHRGRRRLRAPPSAGGTGTCSSTSSRTSTPPSSGCCGPGWAAAPTFRGRRRRPGHLRVLRRGRRLPRRLRPSGSPARAVVRLEENYRSTPQILAVADAVLAAEPRGCRAELALDAGAARRRRLPVGPRSLAHRRRRSHAEVARGRPGRAPSGRGASPGGTSPCSCRTNAQSPRSRRRCAPRWCLRRARRGAASWTGPRSAPPSTSSGRAESGGASRWPSPWSRAWAAGARQERRRGHGRRGRPLGPRVRLADDRRDGGGGSWPT